MPLFEYTVEGKRGKLESGTIEAINKVAAIRKIKNSGKTLYLIHELDSRLAAVHERVERLKRITAKPVPYIAPERKKTNWFMWLIPLVIVAALLLIACL